MKRITITTVLILLLAAGVQAGVQWSAKITTTDQKGRTHEMLTTVSAQDGNYRQEFSNVAKGQRNQYVEDGYWLYKGRENMLYIVNHKQKTVTPLSLDALQQMMQAMGPMVSMKLEDVNVRVENLGTGTVLGFPCSHVKIDRSYTMKMKITVIKKTMRMEEEMEIWSSTAVPAYASIRGAFMQRSFKTGWEDLDALIQKQMAAMKDLGLPLKTVTRTRRLDKKGRVKADTLTTMEVQKLESKAFPADYFTVPADYKVQETPALAGEPAGDKPAEGRKKKKFKLF